MTEKKYSNEQFTYCLLSVSLLFFFLFSSFLFFVVGLFWFSSFSQSVVFFLVLFLYLSIFLLSFRVSFVLEVLHSVSDSLSVSLLSSRFKIFIGRFFDRLVQTQVQNHAMWPWTGLRHQIWRCCILPTIAIIHIQI